MINTTENNTTVDEDYDSVILASIYDHIKPEFYHWIFFVLFTAVFLIGAGGNFLVCYAVWQSRSLKTVTNYFLVNLAAADLLVIIVCLPASVLSEGLQSWFLGPVMCKVFVYLQVNTFYKVEKCDLNAYNEQTFLFKNEIR